MISELYTLFIDPFIGYLFMKRALVVCLCISLSSAPVGVFLILRRMSLMGEALSHGILPGIAIAFFLAGFSLTAMTIGGVLAGLLIAISSTVIAKKTILHEDASFSALYILSLAVGVFLLSIYGGTLNLMHLLFGGVLAITVHTMVYVAIITTITLLMLIVFYRPLVYDCFDPLYARIKGVPTKRIQVLFICLVVLNLVAACQALGTLMALGIMMIPAITARLISRKLSTIIQLSVLIGMISSYLGLVISFHTNVPSGPTIIIVCGVVYLFTALYRILAPKSMRH